MRRNVLGRTFAFLSIIAALLVLDTLSPSARIPGVTMTLHARRDRSSNADQVVLNWQQGKAAAHSVPPDTSPGSWITGVRAHENSSGHSAPFISISVALTVSSLIVTELQFDPGSVESEGSFTATFSGTNLTPETYFDIRFRAPCSDKDQVVSNWQRGTIATHRVPAGTPTGIWTISGVWAHQDINDHSSDFASRSTSLLVYQQSAVPFSGKVTSIAVDPSRSATVYAATIGSGVYKTCDGGQTWMVSGAGLPDTDILRLALGPASPWIVYAGTSVGVFRSVDGGEHWEDSWLPASNVVAQTICALVVDPSNPAVIYAGTLSPHPHSSRGSLVTGVGVSMKTGAGFERSGLW